MATPLRPQHFVSRQDGSLTALVAVDELPSCVTVRGVPRVLNQSDTHGMTSLGTLPSRGQSYVVDYVHQGNNFEVGPPATRSPSDEDFTAPAHSAAYSGYNASSHSQAGSAWRNTDSTGRDVVKHNAGPRKGGSSSASKKEYCSFWLRHGECDYQQQGCIFKHEMPTDLATLEKLGLRDIPRWYREKHGLKSITIGGAGPTRGDRVWRGDGQAESQAVEYNNQPARYIMPAAAEGDGRGDGQVQYAPTASAGPHYQASERADLPTVNHRNGGGNISLGSHTGASKDTQNIHRSTERLQMWNRLDLLSQDELPEYRRTNNGGLSFQHGLTGFRDPNGSANYPTRNNRTPTMSRTPQAISNDSQRVNEGKTDNHLRSSKPTDGAIWATRDNQPNDLSSLTMAPFNSMQQSANQLTEQNGYGKRKNQRSRRLYQARVAADGADPHVRPAAEVGKAHSDKQSDTPSPIGSTSPGKQSEDEKKVKSNNVHGLDGTIDTTSEHDKTTDTSSGRQTPDDDPFGLKLEY